MWQLGECRWRAFADYLSASGVPARVPVHGDDAPVAAPSYEFYGTALLQRALRSDGSRPGVMLNGVKHLGSWARGLVNTEILRWRSE